MQHCIAQFIVFKPLFLNHCFCGVFLLHGGGETRKKNTLRFHGGKKNTNSPFRRKNIADNYCLPHSPAELFRLLRRIFPAAPKYVGETPSVCNSLGGNAFLSTFCWWFRMRKGLTYFLPWTLYQTHCFKRCAFLQVTTLKI